MDVDKLVNELVVDGKLVSSMKVVDLKDELKKRGLKNAGNKSQLQELLCQALLEEKNAAANAGDTDPKVSNEDSIDSSVVATSNDNSCDSEAAGDTFSSAVNETDGIKLSIIRTTPRKGEEESNEEQPSEPQAQSEPSEPQAQPESSELQAQTGSSEPQAQTEPSEPQAKSEPAEPQAKTESSEPSVPAEPTTVDAEMKEESSQDSSMDISQPIEDEKEVSNKDDQRSDSPKLKIRPRKLTINNKSQESDNSEKKPRWGAKRESSVAISSNDLKQIIDDSMSQDESNKVGKSDAKDDKIDSSLEKPSAEDIQATPEKKDEAPIEKNVEKVSTENDSEPRQISPAKNTPTNILHVCGLARPYTTPSLKRILTQFAPIDEEKFWTDKKRSECYAVYPTVDDAIKTREQLHGLRWPVSSPKILSVDFKTDEDLEKCLNPPPEQVEESLPKKEKNGLNFEEGKLDIKPDSAAENRNQNRSSGSGKTIREWDKNKDSEDLENRSSKRRRSPSLQQDSPVRKGKSRREDSPRRDDRMSGLKLDDVFKKTVTIPHVYFKPLTEEEVREKERNPPVRRPRPPRMRNKNRKFGGKFGGGPPPFRRRSFSRSRSRSPRHIRDRSFSPDRRGGYRPQPGGRYRSPLPSGSSYRRADSPPPRRSPPRRGSPMRRRSPPRRSPPRYRR